MLEKWLQKKKGGECETTSDSKALLGEENGGKKKRGGGERIEGIERELSQIESVCLGWY